MDARKDQITTPPVPEIDTEKLLGFERLRPEQEASINAEEAVAVAFNKRGEAPVSDRRLKTDVRSIGDTADGLHLYAFRYTGDDREFRGLMAQDLLADPSVAHAVQMAEGGYYCVDYGKLGLGYLVTDEMREAGAQALARSLAA